MIAIPQRNSAEGGRHHPLWQSASNNSAQRCMLQKQATCLRRCKSTHNAWQFRRRRDRKIVVVYRSTAIWRHLSSALLQQHRRHCSHCALSHCSGTVLIFTITLAFFFIFGVFRHFGRRSVSGQKCPVRLKLHYTDTGTVMFYHTINGHHQRTSSQQICHIAMPQPNISTCQDVGMWQIFVRRWWICCTTSCRIVASSSVGGVRSRCSEPVSV